MIYIVADDLTGASDTGVQYKRQGLRTLISAEIDLQLLDAKAGQYDIIAVNADTRAKPSQAAYVTTYKLVEHIKHKPFKYIYKKMDSVLRGNVAQELEAMMAAMDIPLAVVAISYPENGRTLCNGILTISNTNSIHSGIDAVKVFTEGMSIQVQGIHINEVQKGKEAVIQGIRKGYSCGKQVFVIDAVTEEDLAVIRDATLAMGEKIILCGSAGLAKQLSLLEAGKAQSAESNVPQESGITLVLIGSYNACTAEQVQILAAETGMPMLTLFSGDVLQGTYNYTHEELLQQADELVSGGCKLLAVVVDTLLPGFTAANNGKTNVIRDSQSITNAMGSLARQLCDRYKVSAIISSGGDTSLAVLKALHAKGIELDAEIVPGVPAGRLIGGMAEGIRIVTKSGGFGQKDCLVRTIEYLNRE